MYNLETFVIAVYCLIADDVYPAFCQMKDTAQRKSFILSALGNATRRLIETVCAQLTQRFKGMAMKARDACRIYESLKS